MQSTTGYIALQDGVRLHFTTVSPASGKPRSTIVIPNEIYMFDDFRHLGAEHRVIFYDLRNRGRSDLISDPEKLTRGVHRDIEDLEAVRKHFQLERFSLIAHSYVSVIVALYAMSHPEHVERVVQIGPPPPNMSKELPADQRFADEVSMQVFAQLQQFQLDRSIVDPVERCKRTWDILRPLYVGRAEQASKLAQWGFCELATERGMSDHFNRNIQPTLQALALSAADFAKASMPVLVIHGGRDRSAPIGGGIEWARSLPNSRLMRIDEAGHVPHIEAAAQVMRAIERFLDGEWPSEARRID